MHIALTGEPNLKAEMKARLASGNNIEEFNIMEIDSLQNPFYDLVIDCSFDSNPSERWPYLSQINTQHFLLGSILTELSLWNWGSDERTRWGFCNIPGFINRSHLEYSAPQGNPMPSEWVLSLGYEAAIEVQDRVGLASPRVIAMIINEAYYTVQEGTATREDIDMGMKLGTAYPLGPFEWTKKIGVHTVYTLLNQVYHDTQDERYKICNLLKTEAMQNRLELNN